MYNDASIDVESDKSNVTVLNFNMVFLIYAMHVQSI